MTLFYFALKTQSTPTHTNARTQIPLSQAKQALFISGSLSTVTSQASYNVVK